MQFHRYTWIVLAYTLAVVLGGAFVRATVSGDGCGNNWPDCGGEWIPLFPERVETLIEFSHRASSGLLLPLTLILMVWAFRRFPGGHPARGGSVAVFLLIIVESLIGAALVIYGWVGYDRSAARAVVMPAHLVTTFVLLAALTLTAWWGGGGERLRLRGQGESAAFLGLAMVALLLLGASGAVTALGNVIFPAGSLEEGFRQNLAPGTHFLIALRVYHPVIAVATGVLVWLAARVAAREHPTDQVRQTGDVVVGLFAAQIVLGFVNLALLAPIWMQLVHLLIANLIWVGFVLLGAARLSSPATEEAAARQPRPRPQAPPATAPRATWRAYLALTKPRVLSLLILTALSAVWIAGAETGGVAAGVYLVVALGIFLSAGSANAFNMVFERDLDQHMERTAKRPVASAQISPAAGFRFASVLGAGAIGLLWWLANPLAAVLAAAALVVYVPLYTLLLKRRTWWNIVIGGAAGAFPPLIGWAAATGELTPLAWCLFGLVFLWTPVHFWALAIALKEDYARAGVPMLPVVRGEKATGLQIVGYALLTAGISLLPFLLHASDGRAAVGGFYLLVALLLNAALLSRSFRLYRQPDTLRARGLFRFSMAYLAILFLVMAVDRTFWL